MVWLLAVIVSGAWLTVWVKVDDVLPRNLPGGDVDGTDRMGSAINVEMVNVDVALVPVPLRVVPGPSKFDPS